MPTYDYSCSACGHRLELFQSISEPRKRKCPRCKKPKLERLIGQGAGILFKGGGFYQTDYRSDAYKKSESAEKAGSEPKTEAVKSDAAKSEPSTSDASKSASASESSKSRTRAAGTEKTPASKKRKSGSG
jgi:putative FmdB family regulatory protein